ncbi:type IV secretion system DNA-binding domain-containing protein [Brevibacterium sp.]|uniref:type IV secretory system conjugative DNA transfer family protein n=1 Tax=Brevibacterium sp. TaxID=1701 RepID=UPI00281219E7|nr:type IV secretion system DNA-binding domain-containing protein [Brevibacterium sp.]
MNTKSTHTWQWHQLAWDDALTPGMAAAVLERLATAPELGTIVLELRARKSGIRWLVGTTPPHARDLAGLLTQLLPARVTTPRAARRPVTVAAKLARAGTPGVIAEDRLLAATRALYAGFTRLAEGEELVLQVLLGKRLNPRATEQPPSWSDLILGHHMSKPLSAGTAAARARSHQHGFTTTIRLAAVTEKDDPARARFMLTQTFGALRVLETQTSRFRLSPFSTDKVDRATRPLVWPLRMPSSDVAGFTGWPIGDPPLPMLGSLHPKQLPPPPNLVATDRGIGRAAAPGHEHVKVGIPIRDALFHTHLLGPTGSGKSSVLLNLFAADVRAGRSAILLDPKGDLASDALTVIPENRQADVIVVDPTNPCPVGFNPLAPTGTAPEITADGLLATFQSLFAENWGIRTQDVLTASLITLARTPGANLLWLPPLLTNPVFRRKVLAHNDPLGVDAFWHQYEQMKPDRQVQEIGPVLNKFRQLVLRPHLRAVLGQSVPAFGFEELFTKRRIVIVNLNKALLGHDAARLLGSLILGQVWHLLLARQRLPKERRHVVGIYIDEVHDFLAGIPGDLSDALAQARSLGGAFHLAHQYRAQLTEQMASAIETNTRNKIVFGLGGTDASYMAKHAEGLDKADFQLLPAYHAYAQLMHHGRQTGWMQIATAPPPNAISDPADVYAASHHRFGVSAVDTDATILDLIQPPNHPTVAEGESETAMPIRVGRRRT